METEEEEEDDYETHESEEEVPELSMDALTRQILALEKQRKQLFYQERMKGQAIAGPSTSYAGAVKAKEGSPSRVQILTRPTPNSPQQAMEPPSPAQPAVLQDESMRFGDFDQDQVMTESANLIQELDQTIAHAVDYAQAGPSNHAGYSMAEVSIQQADDQPEFELVINRSTKKPATEGKLRRQKKK
jgi:hypothetical protein